MKNNKSELDEMQKSRRDKIGNQTFMLLFYLLMLDSALYGFGIRWLNYPANVMIVITICMILYLVRIILNNSYVVPGVKKSKPAFKLTVIIMFSVLVAAIAAVLLKNDIKLPATGSINDNSALILFIISGIGLIIALIVTIIKKVSDGKGES